MHPIYPVLPYEDLRLHTAALDGDVELIHSLVNAGLNVNSRDIFSSTPLHLATLNGHLEAVSTLLALGAIVDATSYFKLTPLYLASKYQHTEVVSRLIAAGADPNHFLKNKETIFHWLIEKIFNEFEHASIDSQWKPSQLCQDIEIYKQLADPTNGKPLIIDFSGETTIPASVLLSLIAKIPADAMLRASIQVAADDITVSELHNTYIDTKNLLHTFPMSDQYKFETSQGSALQIQAEGHWRYWTTPLAQNSVENYLAFLQPDMFLQKTIFQNISQILKEAENMLQAGFAPETTQDILTRYSNGETILFPTGWEGHFITIILSNNKLIISNSGQRFDLKPSGTMFYEITRSEAIDADLISKILNNQYQADLEYDLHYILGLKLTYIIGAPDQEFGNCAWHSFLPAIESLIFLELEKLGLNEQHSRTMAYDYFEEWNNFHKDSILANYLERYPEAPFELIKDLLVEQSLHQDEASQHRALILADTLSEPYYEDQFANFIINQPIGWLRLDGILKSVGIDLHSGRKKPIDIRDVIDYDDLVEVINHGNFDNPSLAAVEHTPIIWHSMPEEHSLLIEL